MMALYLELHLMQASRFPRGNIIWGMQVMDLHRTASLHTVEFDIIFENGVKVMNGISNTSYYADCSPRNAQELFNLRHSSLRNAIERIFGVTQKRFRVLTTQLEYPYEIQVRLVKAICCMHNIIRLTGGDDWFDELWEKSQANTRRRRNSRSEVDVVVRKAVTAADTRHAKSMRDKIAEQMYYVDSIFSL